MKKMIGCKKTFFNIEFYQIGNKAFRCEPVEKLDGRYFVVRISKKGTYHVEVKKPKGGKDGPTITDKDPSRAIELAINGYIEHHRDLANKHGEKAENAFFFLEQNNKVITEI